MKTNVTFFLSVLFAVMVLSIASCAKGSDTGSDKPNYLFAFLLENEYLSQGDSISFFISDADGNLQAYGTATEDTLLTLKPAEGQSIPNRLAANYIIFNGYYLYLYTCFNMHPSTLAFSGVSQPDSMGYATLAFNNVPELEKTDGSPHIVASLNRSWHFYNNSITAFRTKAVSIFL